MESVSNISEMTEFHGKAVPSYSPRLARASRDYLGNSNQTGPTPKWVASIGMTPAMQPRLGLIPLSNHTHGRCSLRSPQPWAIRFNHFAVGTRGLHH